MTGNKMLDSIEVALHRYAELDEAEPTCRRAIRDRRDQADIDRWNDEGGFINE